MHKLFFGSTKKIIIWSSLGWALLSVLNFWQHGLTAFMGWTGAVVAVLIPVNYLIWRKKHPELDD